MKCRNYAASSPILKQAFEHREILHLAPGRRLLLQFSGQTVEGGGLLQFSGQTVEWGALLQFSGQTVECGRPMVKL